MRRGEAGCVQPRNAAKRCAARLKIVLQALEYRSARDKQAGSSGVCFGSAVFARLHHPRFSRVSNAQVEATQRLRGGGGLGETSGLGGATNGLPQLLNSAVYTSYW
ncbi:hypothetical protein PUN28_005157 [Cardiocondyla obscurior]|uniref:Uncharacterized protein n=1 Tax=Cardiocondyla obscurior TaxID=286306 RepID=A0AAW2GJ14_9HYME